MKFNGSEISTKASLVVLPGEIEKIKVKSNLSISGNAEEKYRVDVQAFDKFDNLCKDYKPNELRVNLES